ncbi:hypothetical protein JCM9279_000399 [Rhodotorula babjevae]
MLALARAPLRALRTPTSTPSPLASSSRHLSSIVSPASHPARCACARCASRSAPTSTIVRAPTHPSSSPSSPSSSGTLSSFASPLGATRLASRLAPTHPRACGCAGCAPRAAPAAAGLVGVPARPGSGSSAATVAARQAALVNGVRTMKVKSSVKIYCSGCQSVRRKGTVFILCSLNPKHKQRQG